LENRKLGIKRDLEKEQHLIESWNFKGMVDYAKDIIKGRWPEVEHIIARNPQASFYYARYVLKDRFLEAEMNIIKDICWITPYASAIIKDRWPEAEPTLLDTQKFCYTWWSNYKFFLERIGRDIDIWDVEIWK